MGTLNGQVESVKAARMSSPHQICYLRPVANEIDAIAAISFLNDVAVIKDLRNELPRYLEKAWWMNNAHQPTYQTGLFSSFLTQSSQFSHFLFFVNSSSITFFSIAFSIFIITVLLLKGSLSKSLRLVLLRLP